MPDELVRIYELQPDDRYLFTVKMINMLEQVWLITDKEGDYPMMGETEDEKCLPVFPQKEFAEVVLIKDMADFKAEPMSLSLFIDWLDDLQDDGVKISVLPKANMHTIVVSASDFKNHLATRDLS